MLEKFTILVAEDDENAVWLLKQAFQEARIINPLRIVGDGEEVINYLAGEGEYADRTKNPFPCLLLLDLTMPRMDGFAVLEWIRSQPRIKRLQVVIMTVHRHDPCINRAYELGANSYLVKPAQYSDLVELAKQIRGYWMMVNERPDIGPG